MIQYFDKLIPENICTNILEYAENSPPEFKRIWNEKHLVGGIWLFQNKPLLQSLFFLTQLSTKHYGKMLFPELFEIAKMPINSSHPPHLDDTRKSTKYTSITYLNENYTGGKTYFTEKDFTSKNKIGDTLMFDGGKYRHGVTEVIEGNRYILSVWYSDNINDFILNW